MDNGSEGFGGTTETAASVVAFPRPAATRQVTFDRRELTAILNVYGRMVAAGEWRDYAIDHLADRAIFSVFRRASEAPLHRIEKTPRNACCWLAEIEEMNSPIPASARP